MKNQLFICAAILLLGAFGACTSNIEKPNVLLIYVDDLGYGDLACYGGKDIATPNIDQLARDGIRFTDAHVSCAVCGPSRVGLMTGIYQQKLGCYWNNDLWDSNGWNLSDSIILIPQVMKQAGYYTGQIGKWNVTEESASYFDEVHDVMLWKGAYYPDENGHYKGVNEGDFNPEPHGWGSEADGEYLTDRLTRHATSFIDQHHEEPFFLYLAYNAPHTPLNADIKFDSIYSHLEPEPYRIYAGMVHSLDENIGKVLAKLKELALDENTLIIFASDNGPAKGARYIKGWIEEWPTTLLGSTGGLNGNKASRYEGGHRIPYIIKWPGKLQEGSEYDGLSSTLDIFPTILDAAGIEEQAELQLDGKSLLPFLFEENEVEPHEKLFWMTHSQAAVRSGDWKLITGKNKQVSLYNLNSDRSEKNDVSSEFPEQVQMLLGQLNEWSNNLPVSVSQKSKFDIAPYLGK